MNDAWAVVVASAIGVLGAFIGVLGTLLAAHLQRRGDRRREGEEREGREAAAEAAKRDEKRQAQHDLLLDLQRKMTTFGHAIESIRKNQRPGPVQAMEDMRGLASRIADEDVRTRVAEFFRFVLETWRESDDALDSRPGSKRIESLDHTELEVRYRAIQETIGNHLRALG